MQILAVFLVFCGSFWFVSATIVCDSLRAQSAPRHRPQFMKFGLLQHHENAATVYANFPRPLMQALAAVHSEYGWIVNYEDPPYASGYDLVDATDPTWRANHPNEEGYIGIGGGLFQSTFLENPTTATSSDEEERVLNKIVADYNSSGNPGKFVVRKEADNIYSVIGKSIKDNEGEDQQVSSILDTIVSVPTKTQNAAVTIDAVFLAVSDRTGTHLVNGWMANNLLLNSYVSVGGNQVSARSLLRKTLDATNRPSLWTMIFDPNDKTYVMEVSVAVQTMTDSLGRKLNAPIDMKEVYRHLRMAPQQN